MNCVKDEKNKLEQKTNKLVNFVNYKSGSIARKTIIDKKTVSVTVVAFDKSQEIVEHVPAYEALFFVLEGEAEVSIESEFYFVKEGETIILPASKPHAIDAKSRFKALLITFKE